MGVPIDKPGGYGEAGAIDEGGILFADIADGRDVAVAHKDIRPDRETSRAVKNHTIFEQPVLARHNVPVFEIEKLRLL
jgi:hypothetical protein